MLDSVLRRLPRPTDPNVLVGFDTNDDAGVYLLGDGMALVQTVDFFTPIVDDPHTFGQIAAANALSDVYAMGGKPVSALSIVGFPDKGDPEILERIIRGGLSKMTEAKCSVIGGHSIRNEDIQFGYAVTGVIHPHRVWRNVGAREGDALLLTKAIGTGVLSTALKRDHMAAADLEAAITSMTQLNRAASEALQEVQEKAGEEQPIHAVTDVTGFGLLGHARDTASIFRGESPSAISREISKPCPSTSIMRLSPIFLALSKPRAEDSSPADSKITAISLAIAWVLQRALRRNIATSSSTRKLPAAC